MSGPTARLSFVSAIAVAGLIAINSGAQSNANEPQRCEIVASEQGRMIMLESVFHTDKRVFGSYHFTITGADRSGGTNISQSSEFSATPGKANALGRMMVSSGKIYDVSLEVIVGGKKMLCEERIGDLI